jgi:hypothetical protein
LKAETLSSSCFLNDGKGNFQRIDLPEELQMAPIMSFSNYSGQSQTFMAAGNFYGVLPYEGRYDALLPTVFSFDKGKPVIDERIDIPSVTGEMRDIKWLNSENNSKLLVLARNNDSLIFLKPTDTAKH